MYFLNWGFNVEERLLRVNGDRVCRLFTLLTDFRLIFAQLRYEIKSIILLTQEFFSTKKYIYFFRNYLNLLLPFSLSLSLSSFWIVKKKLFFASNRPLYILVTIHNEEKNQKPSSSYSVLTSDTLVSDTSFQDATSFFPFTMVSSIEFARYARIRIARYHMVRGSSRDKNRSECFYLGLLIRIKEPCTTSLLSYFFLFCDFIKKKFSAYWILNPSHVEWLIIIVLEENAGWSFRENF